MSFVKQLDYLIRDTLRFVLHDSMADVLGATRQCPEDLFETPPPLPAAPREHARAALVLAHGPGGGGVARARRTRRGGKNKSAEIARCFQELVRETIRENELRKQEDAPNAFAPAFLRRPTSSCGWRLIRRTKARGLASPPAETFTSEIESAVARLVETLATTRRLPSDAALMAKMAAAAEADASRDG